MNIRPLTAAICSVWLFIASPILGADLYKWTDESGTVNFSDSLDNVPQKYRNQLEKRKAREDSGQSVAIQPPSKGDTNRGKAGEASSRKHEIPYTNAYGGGRRGAVVQVTFNDRITAPMLLDTGAVGITISREVAERLGLLDKGESTLIQAIGGVGGSAMTVRTIIKSAQMGSIKEEFVPVNIMFNRLSSSFEGLLGMELLGNYKFGLNPERMVVELEELPSGKNLPAGRDEGWWQTNFQELNSYREQWQQWINFFDRKISEESMFVDKVKTYKEYKEYSTSQYKAADELLTRLNRFAIDNHVPTHWRR